MTRLDLKGSHGMKEVQMSVDTLEVIFVMILYVKYEIYDGESHPVILRTELGFANTRQSSSTISLTLTQF